MISRLTAFVACVVFGEETRRVYLLKIMFFSRYGQRSG